MRRPRRATSPARSRSSWRRRQHGYGWAIAKSLAEAGCKTQGTWPPVLAIFKKSLEGGKMDADRELSGGRTMDIDKIYPLDAVFDTPEDVPEETKTNKRYAGLDGYTISEVAKQIEADYGKIDFMIHSLANGPEVTKPLLETSRRGYLGANSASAYSFVSLVQHCAPIMNEGGAALSLTYIASEDVIPGYGGGMSSAKAALESDTRTLAWEADAQVRHPRQHHLRRTAEIESRLGHLGTGQKSSIDLADRLLEGELPARQGHADGVELVGLLPAVAAR